MPNVSFMQPLHYSSNVPATLLTKPTLEQLISLLFQLAVQFEDSLTGMKALMTGKQEAPQPCRLFPSSWFFSLAAA